MRPDHPIPVMLTSLLLIICVSGCTMPAASQGGTGVVITDFSAEFPEYYIGEPVNFQVRIKNTGSVDALYVVVELLNLEGWETTGSPDCEFEKLIAPNPDMGTSGESRTCTFSYNAPRELPQGLSFAYNPMVRVTYSYESSTVKSITIASQSELRNIQDSGRALPSDTVSSGNGPISISINSRGPIRFWQDLMEVTFPMEIKLSNIGGGTAYQYESGFVEGNNMIYMETRLSEGLGLEDTYCGNREIELWHGKSFETVCNVRAGNLESTAPVQKIIEVTANYNYIIEKQSQVTVKWRDTGTSGF